MSKPELAKTETRVEQADARAREIERQMTAEERFSLIISLSGATGLLGGVRDKRYPEDAPLTAGYTPGVPRLGIPALLSSDASMYVSSFVDSIPTSSTLPTSSPIRTNSPGRNAREYTTTSPLII